MFGAAPVCCFSCNLLVKLLLEMTNCKLNSYHISAALAFRVSVVIGDVVWKTHTLTRVAEAHTDVSYITKTAKCCMKSQFYTHDIPRNGTYRGADDRA